MKLTKNFVKKKIKKTKPNANSHYRVNFKKNEKAYNSAGSEVLKALKESENDPPEPGKIYLFYIFMLKNLRC